MKKLLTVLSLLICGTVLMAQIPSSFKYQAVARQMDNTPYSNTDISLQITILQGDAMGTNVFQETLSTTTSDLGIFSLNIGAQSTDLADLDWAAGPYFLQIEMDPTGGNAFELMGTSEILSVPTAIYAAKAGNVDDALQTISIDPASQSLVLSNNGGSVLLSELGGGGSDADADPTNEIQTLTWNGASQEISISDGNAITIPLQSGSSGTLIQDTDGDTKVQVEADTDDDALSVTLENLEALSLVLNNDGSAVLDFPSSQKNIFIGKGVGTKNEYSPDSITTLNGDLNTFVGSTCGINNTIGRANAFYGFRAGQLNRDGSFNTFMGATAGTDMSEGQSNTFIGNGAGGHMATGNNNTFIGQGSGGNINEANNNTFIGRSAGRVGGGDNNVFLGFFAGEKNREGSGNVFIGTTAGQNDTSSFKLIIDNSSSATPLIEGNFQTDYLKINGRLGMHVQHGNTLVTDGFKLDNKLNTDNNWRMFVSSTTGELMLFSTAFSDANGANANVATIDPNTGVFSSLSDRRVKTNFEGLNTTLASILKLKAFKYHFLGQKDDARKSIGFMAQEVNEHFPELVSYSTENELYHLNYNGLSVLAITAIQEQQDIIEDQQTQLNELNTELDDLKNRLLKIEALLNK